AVARVPVAGRGLAPIRPQRPDLLWSVPIRSFDLQAPIRHNPANARRLPHMDRNVNRRDFLGTVAAASATLLAAARPARAQTPAIETLGPPQAPAGRRLKAGLIGCGGRGRGAMINFLDAGPDLEITALADVFPDR